jgi:hypothetical protein
VSDLHGLLPPLDRFVPGTALKQWLARGDRLAAHTPGYFSALGEHFRWPEGALPAAALIRQVLTGDAGEHVWLCADPAWVQPEMNGARLLACGNLDLNMEQAREFVAALDETFAEQSMALEVGDASHWQVRLPGYIDMPTFAEPEEALGADMLQHLPQGPEGRRWRALINEAQIILHQHPLNQVRRQVGRPPVNSVWLWGGGALPAWVESGLSRVISDDLLVWALAGRAGVDVCGRDSFTSVAAEKVSSSAFELLDLQDIQAGEIESSWWPRIEAGLVSGRFGQVRMLFASGERWSMRASHRWRFWRKASTL